MSICGYLPKGDFTVIHLTKCKFTQRSSVLRYICELKAYSSSFQYYLTYCPTEAENQRVYMEKKAEFVAGRVDLLTMMLGYANGDLNDDMILSGRCCC